MLFGNLFQRQKPRGLSWTARYHDPADDEALPGGEFDPDDDAQLEAMRRQSRIQFERYRAKSGRQRGPSPFLLLFFVVLVGALIFGTQSGPGRVDDVTLGHEDAVDAPRSSAGRPPADIDAIAGEELIIQIERGGQIFSDTIRGREELERLLEEQGMTPDPDSLRTAPAD